MPVVEELGVSDNIGAYLIVVCIDVLVSSEREHGEGFPVGRTEPFGFFVYTFGATRRRTSRSISLRFYALGYERPLRGQVPSNLWCGVVLGVVVYDHVVLLTEPARISLCLRLLRR